MKRSLFNLSILFLIMSFLIVGCTKDNSTGKSVNDGKNDSTETIGEKETLILAQSADIPTMDPQDALSSNAERVFANMYSRLFYMDENTELQKDLVKRYEQIDEVTWVFELHDSVKFHNGDLLTAEDVKYTYDRLMTDQTLTEYPFFTQLEAVNVLDEFKVEFITDGSMPQIFNLLAKTGADIIPKNYIEEVGFDEFLKAPIGSGPYKFVKWELDDRVVLEAFDDYFGDEPKWKEVIVRTIPESSTRVAELLTGGVDVIIDVPPNEVERINKEEGLSTIRGKSTSVALLLVRTTEGTVTADPKVREAIDLAINNEILVDSILEGNGVPVRTRVSDDVFGVNLNLYDTYVHDLEKAKTLLSEAGYSDGITVNLTASNGRYMRDAEVAEAIAAMLGEAGINVNLELLESSAFIDVYSADNNKELFMISLGDGLLDASYPLVQYTEAYTTGETDYYNEEVEKLFSDAIGNRNDEERDKQFQKIQEIVAEERPNIFLYQTLVNYGVSDSVKFNPRLDQSFIYDDILPN